MPNIFTVQNSDLAAMNPQKAVNTFRELLWAEATAIGLAKRLVNVPGAITVGDGGVDAEVEGALSDTGLGIIRAGFTTYQIKSGAFQTHDASLRKLFYRRGNELHRRVEACFQRGGTFVVVLFGWDNPDRTEQELVSRCIRLLPEKYRSSNVEVWRQNQLIGFLAKFPSLALDVAGRGDLDFKTHRSWSDEAEMALPLSLGDPQSELIGQLRSALREGREAVHVRVCGEAGIGKTRLVLEATRSDDLKPLTLYYGSGEKCRRSALLNLLTRPDNDSEVVLVIDECEFDLGLSFWNDLKHSGPRIRLITISHDFDEQTPRSIRYLGAPPLRDEQTSLILQGYVDDRVAVERWVPECCGSPRVAHLVGLNLRDSPEDLLATPDTVDVWGRFIVGGDRDTDNVRQRRLVLQYLSLFKRFGYGHHVIGEAREIAKLVAAANADVTWARFQEIVHYLRERKILQGESTLYITPKLLQVKLWTEWWEIYGTGFQVEGFDALPEKLREWFYEMFEYAASSPASAQVVRDLLGPRGPFADFQYLRTRLGAAFFFALAKADPEASLRYLEGTIGQLGREQLLELTDGRREVVYTLEGIVRLPHLFQRGARILLALAEAENEDYSNNATGILAEMYAVGPGPVANTAATAEERFPILAEAFQSGSRERAAVALRACDAALESGHWVRSTNGDYIGLKRQPELWQPKTYGEIFDAYRRVWRLVCAQFGSLDEQLKRQALDILLSRGATLAQMENLSELVFDSLREIARRPDIDKSPILRAAVRCAGQDGLMPAEQRFWEELECDLTGEDFGSRLRRFVGLHLWPMNSVQDLADLALIFTSDARLFSEHVRWLVSPEAQNGLAFGYEVGKRDSDRLLLPRILDAQRLEDAQKPSLFLAGYLRSMFDHDEAAWTSRIERLAADPQTCSMLPEMVWRSASALNERVGELVLDLMERGAVSPSQLKTFEIGTAIHDLTPEIFRRWIEFLLSRSDKLAAEVAVHLYSSYYTRCDKGDRLPAELTERLLLHPILFKDSTNGSFDQMTEYHWTEIASHFVHSSPDRSLVLLSETLERSGLGAGIFHRYRRQATTLLKDIVRRCPSGAWEVIRKLLGPPLDSRAFHIWRWLGERTDPPLAMIPPDSLWQWVEGNAAVRAPILARFVPRDWLSEDNPGSLARELLVRYGVARKVRVNLRHNFATESWWGPASSHHQSKLEILKRLQERESNPNVRTWIEEYMSELLADVASALVEEERFAI